MDNIKKIRRTATVASVLAKYGFESLLTDTGLRSLIPKSYKVRNRKEQGIFSLSIYQRIRMALEELGPTFVKLGQLMSTRDDLLPEELTSELKKLQDDVPSEEIDVKARLKAELKIDADQYFLQIGDEPIAAASLSQVYKATLIEGHKEVILKIKREDIQEVIKSDLLIMKDFAQLFEKYYETARNMGLVQIVDTFENNMNAEMSFVQELGNIERFRTNFKDIEKAYIPTTYANLSNNNILCMEFIDGIKISDKEGLIKAGLDPNIIATTVIDLYMKQVFDYGFFHADPHSGNIFVLSSGQIAFIDYGSVGKLLPVDREHLADLVIYALRKDMKRLVRIIKKIAIRYNIPDDSQLERDLYELIETVDNTPIQQIDLQAIVRNFSSVLARNKTVLPEFLYLLVRGIVLLEGIGREICPGLDILKSIEPYGVKMAKEKLSPDHILRLGIDKLYDINDLISEVPADIHSLIKKMEHGDMQVTHNINGLTDIKNTINRLVVAIIILALAVGSGMLVVADMPPVLWGVPVLGFLGFAMAGILSVILIIQIIRNKKDF